MERLDDIKNENLKKHFTKLSIERLSKIKGGGKPRLIRKIKLVYNGTKPTIR